MIPSAPQEKSAGRPGLLARITSPTGLAVAGLLGVTLAFYHELWLPDLVLIKRDASWFHLPIKYHLIERLTAGELPQWFPYEALGRPFIGVAATGVFHPFTALYFFFPVHDAYRASVLLSCLVAALGTFVLGRTLHFSHAGALVAGIAFTLSGYVVSFTEHITYLYSICALPLFCAALEKALVQRRAWVVAPAGIWATVFLNGDIQTGYYYAFIALLWTATRAPKPRLRAWLRLVFIVLLSGLLAGIQLGPTWMVFAGSNRADPAQFHEQALYWSTHPLRLATLLASPIGNDKDQVALARFFFGIPQGSTWAESLYLGVPVAGLALLGAWHRRDLLVLAALGILALLFSLGRWGGIYEIFYHVVPFWSAFRFPEKFMGVASFAVAMLAGAGLDAMRAAKGHPAPWLIAALLCAILGFCLHTEAVGAWMATTVGASPIWTRGIAISAAIAFLFSSIAALGMWIIVTGARHASLREGICLVALTTLVTIDLCRGNMGVYHTGPAAASTFTPPFVEAIEMREGKIEPGRFRTVTILRNTHVTPLHITSRFGLFTAESVERRQALDQEHNAQFHLETVMPYMPAFHDQFGALVEAIQNHRAGPEALARLNVTYYIGRQFRFRHTQFAHSFVAAFPEFDLALYQNPVPAKPRVYLSQRPEPATSPAEFVGLLRRPDFLSGEVDVIETSALTLPDPAPDGSATIEHYAPEEVRVRVDTPQPAVLVLLDAFDQGWTATLESGGGLPILRANALVRAVVVPAGTHTVTFAYQTPLLKAGAWASLAGVLLCLGLIVHEHRRGRHSGNHA